MRTLCLTALVLCSACTRQRPAQPPPPAPADPQKEQRVREAIEAAELCLHWAGEEPYSPERAAEIAQGSEESCARARQLLAEARRAGLEPSREAILAVVLEEETPERCRQVPAQDDASSLLDDEARARCERFLPSTPVP